jgi:thioredoxin 1
MKISPRISAIGLAVFAIFGTVYATSGQQASSSLPRASAFAPLEQWKAAVLAGDVTKLRALYSTNPEARVILASGETNAQADIAFWTGLKARSIKLEIAQSASPEAGQQQVAFQAEIKSAAQNKLQTVYVIDGQLWQKQGAQWRIAATRRGDLTRLQQPLSTDKQIYVPGLNAHTEIVQALKLATQQHKRVLVVFGANWCFDCHVLELAFRRSDVAAVLTPNYEVVHVDVGEYDKNLDIMQQFQVPKERGIPAIAVLDANGKLLYSQKGGEFEKARSLAPDDLVAFLNKWKPS